MVRKLIVAAALIALVLSLSCAAHGDPAAHQLDTVCLTVDEQAFSQLSGGALDETVPCHLTYRTSRGEVTAADQYAVLSPERPGPPITLQQPLKVTAAAGESFDFPLFESRTWSSYPSFTLDNAGGDGCYTRLADGVQTLLVEKYIDTSLITLAWKPVAVYINGEYWGEYSLRESLDGETIARYEGFDSDRASEIVILRASQSVVQGSAKEYLALRERIGSLNPAENPEDLAALESVADPDSYLDWLAIKMFFGDTDTSSLVFYQLPGGRWKCLLQGMHFGLFYGAANTPSDFLLPAGMGTLKINSIIFLKLLSVPKYRASFLEKAGAIYRTLTTEVMQAGLDECAALIADEMALHTVRWAEDYAEFLSVYGLADGMEWWRQRISRMRNGTMAARPYYFYIYMQFAFGLTPPEMEELFGPQPPRPEI